MSISRLRAKARLSLQNNVPEEVIAVNYGIDEAIVRRDSITAALILSIVISCHEGFHTHNIRPASITLMPVVNCDQNKENP